jgi:hypothetical protein
VVECVASGDCVVAIAAVHLTAVIYNSYLRKIELERLHHAVEATFPSSTSRLIVGDMNTHSEIENDIIPPGYCDIWLDLHKSADDGITVRALFLCSPFV